ncbi:MAG: DarT ssDNA thymidine ADP-ribosyltransferase family protein [Bacteroidia bacterium]|nr:DarT ssDNA thymidine ADP-ribosyltransferase family protein [Bacteroidia bacterium]MDW8135146.1 DarT ssDNA thymidine ADP-ribosyltransferase family protein [Bacteroidia bacterium]
MDASSNLRLFYITAIDNLPSILERGILSRRKVEALSVEHAEIADHIILQQRENISQLCKIDLFRFVNLYFQPRNPMLFRIIKEKGSENICIIQIKSSILDRDDIFIADGNAASPRTTLYAKHSLKPSELNKIIEQTEKEYWSKGDNSKRKIMAECLVPDEVPPSYIHTIFVDSDASRRRVLGLIGHKMSIAVVPEPRLFFASLWRKSITDRLTLIKGDMFFSSMQTLTISVNTKGIMGRGLASRFKYQFPHVYVFYQDLCKRRVLRMGRPYLYKSEEPIEWTFLEEPLPSFQGEPKWFLLFPTKSDWRDKADLDGISKGLDWIVENYEKEGIQSLAVPALGAGLGRLEWYEVGPLIVRKLAQLPIPVEVYLPAEKEIPSDQLEGDFLLG